MKQIQSLTLDPLTMVTRLSQPQNLNVIRLCAFIVTIGVLLGAPVLGGGLAFAQSGGGDVAAAFTDIVTTITDIIQSLTVVVGILGITFWGFGKVARPVFPEVSQMTNQYINGFLVGIVAVFVATSVVEALASAVGGS
jgi:hypothetical protein